jgi:hypothetical protein
VFCSLKKGLQVLIAKHIHQIHHHSSVISGESQALTSPERNNVIAKFPSQNAATFEWISVSESARINLLTAYPLSRILDTRIFFEMYLNQVLHNVTP